MILLNDNFFDGPRAPTQVIVNGDSGTLTREQMTNIRQVYAEFRTAVRLSPAQFFTKEIKLSDGTVVRLESINGQDRVMVWPKGAGSDDWFIFYWLKTFDKSGDFGKDNEPAGKHVLRNLAGVKSLEVFPVDTESLIFRRHVSTDGVFEIWVVAKLGVKPAKACKVISDADDDPADEDGPHTDEVEVWIRGEAGAYDKYCPLPCTLDEDGKIVAFGNPYHGPITGTTLAASGGSVVVATPDSPFTHLVKFKDVPEVAAPLADLWKNYAIARGRTKILYEANGRKITLPENGHLFRHSDGSVYIITYQMTTARRLTVTAEKATVKDAEDPVTLYDGVLSFSVDPTNAGTAIYSVWFNFAPDGSRFCCNFARIYNAADYLAAGDPRVGTVFAVIEGVLTETPEGSYAIACAASVVSNLVPFENSTATTWARSLATSTGTESISLLHGYDYTHDVVESNTGGPYPTYGEQTFTNTMTLTSANYGPPTVFDTGHTASATKLLGGVYSRDSELKVLTVSFSENGSTSNNKSVSVDMTPRVWRRIFSGPPSDSRVEVDSWPSASTREDGYTATYSGTVTLYANASAIHTYGFSCSTDRSDSRTATFSPPTNVDNQGFASVAHALSATYTSVVDGATATQARSGTSTTSGVGMSAVWWDDVVEGMVGVWSTPCLINTEAPPNARDHGVNTGIAAEVFMLTRMASNNVVFVPGVRHPTTAEVDAAYTMDYAVGLSLDTGAGKAIMFLDDETPAPVVSAPEASITIGMSVDAVAVTAVSAHPEDGDMALGSNKSWA